HGESLRASPALERATGRAHATRGLPGRAEAHLAARGALEPEQDLEAERLIARGDGPIAAARSHDDVRAAALHMHLHQTDAVGRPGAVAIARRRAGGVRLPTGAARHHAAIEDAVVVADELDREAVVRRVERRGHRARQR